MSCREPNLQNIPSSRSAGGAAIRKAFVAEDGYKIINAEKQYQDGVATGMYWITAASRVLVSEEEYLEHLRMQH